MAKVELVDKSGINTVLLSGRAARGFEDSFDFTGSLRDRVNGERPGKAPLNLQVIEQTSLAGLHGAALAALDYEVIKPD